MEFKEEFLGNILQEIIDYRGKTPKKLGGDWAKTGIKVLSAKNIKTGKIVQIETIRYVDEELYKKWMKQEVEKGTILITSEAPFGEIYYWNTDEKIVLSQRIFGLKIDEKYNSEYIYYYMITDKFKAELNARATGTTVTGLRQPELLKCKIRIPERKIQDKIASILKKIDRKIELNNKINDNLQQFCNTIFLKWFREYDFPNENSEPYKTSGGKINKSDLGEIPQNWKIGLLQDIVTFSNGYGFKSNELLDKEVPETYKVFKQGNICITGGINEEKTKSWYYKKNSSGLENYILKKGDILMCMTDMKNSTSPLLGHTALMNADNEYIVNQRVGLLRCKKDVVDYPYVYTLSNLDYFLSDIRSRANSGVQVNLSTKGICETKIVIPTKDILDKFDNLARPMYEKMFSIQQENKTLTKLRDTLLPRLMNGEIDLDKIEI